MSSPERDRQLEQWLQRSTSHSTGKAGGCPDAETASAWLDGGLAPAELQEAQAHVASCARCQAFMSALTGVDAVAPDESLLLEPNPSPWRRWLAWGLPLTAAATALLALAVWLRVPPPADRGDASPQAVASPAAPPAAAIASPESDSRSEQRTTAGTPRLSEGQTTVRPVPSSPTPEPSVQGSAEEKRSGPDAGARLAAPETSRSAADAGDTAAVRRSPPRPPAVAAAPPLVAPAVAAPEPRAFAAAANPRPSAFEIVAPGGAARWRVTGEAVERSLDGGSTWVPTASRSTGALTAGSASSPTVCWLVGPAGLVMRTTDGTTWERLTAPVSQDLMAVTAASERVASVVTTDGRTFQTTDGGGTWR